MDEGSGPNTIPDPTLPENLIKDCGRDLCTPLCGQLNFNDKGTGHYHQVP